MTDVALPLLIAIPIVAAVLPLAAGLYRDAVGWPIAAVTTTALVPLAGLLGQTVLSEGRIRYALGGWTPPQGIELVADELSVAVVLMIAVISLAVLAFTRTQGPRRNSFYSGYLLLTGGLMGMALTGDLFNLFVFLEIVGLTTYALVAADRSGASAYASLKYLIVGTVGASLYLVGVGYVFIATGTLNMLDLQEAMAAVGYGDPLLQTGYAFIAAGFALKIAIFPVHSWQPDAYQRAPDGVTMYIAALVSTTAAYALLRVTYTVFTVEFLQANEAITTALLIVAAISIVIGSGLSVIQSDLKRMFAYSSVAQFGMIVAAVALANQTALLGGIVHLVGHGIMKVGLFLAIGLLATGYGVRTVGDLASLARSAPFTAGGFAVLGLALVGIPPSVGFVGKWYIALGAVEGGATGIAVVVIVSTLLTLAYVARIIEKLYFAGGSAGTEPLLDDDTGETPAAVAADGAGVGTGSGDGANPVTADSSVSPAAPVTDAPFIPLVPDRVPAAGLLVLVVTAAVVVGLGFGGLTFETLFEPFFARVFP